MIFNHPDLQKVFPDPPMAALRQGPNLRRYLCKSELTKICRTARFQRNSHFNSTGWKKCSKPCPVCPFAAPPHKTLHSPVNNYEHSIRTQVNNQKRTLLILRVEQLIPMSTRVS